MRFKFDFPISINQIYKTTKRGGWYKTSEAKTYQALVAVQTMQQMRKHGHKTMSGTVAGKFIFITDDNRRRDLDNLHKLLQDGMVQGGALLDDSQIIKKTDYKVKNLKYTSDYKVPSVNGLRHVIVEIDEIDEDDLIDELEEYL